MYPCQHCNKKFKYQSEKLRHEQSHSQQFECDVCSKKFSFLSALHRHEKQHKRTGPAICSECGRSFRDDSLVKRHMNYAHGGTFTCGKCKSKFHSEKALQNHMKIHRPVSEREFRCDFDGCTKTFNFAHNLQNHILTHTNTKKYFCAFCGKGFVQANNLKLHLKTHDKSSKWLYCDIEGCNRKFSSASARKRHLASHENFSEPKIEKINNDKIAELDHNVNKDYFIDIKTLPDTDIEEASIDINQMDTIHEVNDPIDYSVPNNDEDPSIRTCKAVLGCCIVTGDSENNDACLCAQMNDTENELVTEMKSIELGTENLPKLRKSRDSSPNFNIQIDKTKESKNTDGSVQKPSSCDNCACSSICGTNYENELTKENVFNCDKTTDMPKIQYQSNGTVKLDVTFDIDVGVQEEFKFVPMNSCKEILGKCIVSGSVTMGEGCLCAKMMMDERNADAQEIDELTPRPNQCTM